MMTFKLFDSAINPVMISFGHLTSPLSCFHKFDPKGELTRFISRPQEPFGYNLFLPKSEKVKALIDEEIKEAEKKKKAQAKHSSSKRALEQVYGKKTEDMSGSMTQK